MQALVQQEFNMMRTLGINWADAVYRGAPENEIKHQLKLFSWKICFFAGADTLLILPEVSEHLGRNEAHEYKLDCDSIQRQVEKMEKVRSKEREGFNILDHLVRLMDSPVRGIILAQLNSIPQEDKRKLFENYHRTLTTYQQTIVQGDEAPLKNAAEFFDCPKSEQCKILGIKN